MNPHEALKALVEHYENGSEDLFIRFHWADSPAFSAENAYSRPWNWGEMATVCPCTAEGPRCTMCGGRGHDEYGLECGACQGLGRRAQDDCPYCQGDGWVAPAHLSADVALEWGLKTGAVLRGYSCFTHPVDLWNYFAGRAEPDDDDGEVIVFRGRLVGYGHDGEPLAVPTKVVARMSWSEFARYLDEI